METIPVLLPYGYYVNEADMQTVKNYILRREQTAHGLSSRIDALLKDAAAEITRICYRYGVDPRTFTLSSKYNDKMFDDVCRVLDDAEDEIMDLLLDYSLRCTESGERKKSLLPWVVLLGRGNRNLRQMLEGRLRMFAKDLESMIASMSLAKHDVQKAVTRIVSNLHTVYVTPEVKAAFAQSALMKATYIRSRGVKHGNVGSSSSEANNIIRLGEITVQMSWMRNLYLNYERKGAVGFYVGRGSNYPCELCDSKCGYHDFAEKEYFPPFHGHCQCWAIPVYDKA